MIWVPSDDRFTHASSSLFSLTTQQLESVFGVLPDADVILRRTGKSYEHLRALVSDAHVASVWDVRMSSVARDWEVDSTEVDADVDVFVRAHLERWDIGQLSQSILQAVAYGIQPLELVWTEKGEQWEIEEIVAPPPEWFVWSGQGGGWRIRKGLATEALPPGRFVFVQHHPSLINPYGTKLFSRIFWPVTLKKNGMKWWAEFVEKFGAPLLVGRHSRTATDEEATRILQSLEELVSSSVAAVSEDTGLETIASPSVAASGAVHREYVELMNAEISKAILGQTLTTEVGESGALATARVHDEVRHDLARSDRQLVQGVIQQILRTLVRVNFGDDEGVPRFHFRLPEDLQRERVERDEILLRSAGLRPTEQYLSRYGFTTGDLVPLDEQRLSSSEVYRFTEEKRDQLVSGWLREGRQRKTQKRIDELVGRLSQAVKRAKSADEAVAAVMEIYPELDVSQVVGDIENLRWVARAEGGHNARD